MTDLGTALTTTSGNAANKISAIRADTNLSAEARQRRLAKVYIDAVDTNNRLNAEAEKSNNTRQQTLERKLFGIPNNTDPSAMISYRDALERASQIEQGRDSITAMARAVSVGDDHLVRAILRTAYERTDTNTINAYQLHEPGNTADTEELWNLQRTPTNTAIFTAMYSHIDKPAELASLMDYKIRELADQA